MYKNFNHFICRTRDHSSQKWYYSSSSKWLTTHTHVERISDTCERFHTFKSLNILLKELIFINPTNGLKAISMLIFYAKFCKNQKTTGVKSNNYQVPTFEMYTGH